MQLRRTLFRGLIVVAAIGVLAAPRAAWSQLAGTEGIKQGERFAKAGDETVKAITDAENQIKATLSAYNALVGQATKDAKGDYKKLLKKLDDAKEKIAAVRPKTDAMNAQAEAYFKLWATQVANIGDASLKARGDERIASTRKEYDGILEKLRETATTLDPFLKDLGDHINFLGSDLRPDALASLKGDAEKLNKTGETLFSQTDATVGRAITFFGPLKST